MSIPVLVQMSRESGFKVRYIFNVDGMALERLLLLEELSVSLSKKTANRRQIYPQELSRA